MLMDAEKLPNSPQAIWPGDGDREESVDGGREIPISSPRTSSSSPLPVEADHDEPLPSPMTLSGLLSPADAASEKSLSPGSPLSSLPLNVVDIEESLQPTPLEEDRERSIVGAGLLNLGNTCFLNAVLQCITHTVPLVQKLQDVDHPSCSGEFDKFCALCTLRDHIEMCLYMSGRIVRPNGFAKNLNKISLDFDLGNQEDAHEFLRCLLDCVHNCCLDPSWRDHPSSLERDSLVKQVFGGRLISRLRCTDCGRCSDTFETLLDLSLEIEDVDNLKEALDSFTRVEKIDDQEAKFTCEGCNSQVVMEKQLKLEKTPEVVALHLKRFKNDGYFTEKINKIVEYPLELDLRAYVASVDDETKCTYDLYGIVVHRGFSSYGHYISIIRSSPTTWHRMDDSKVSQIVQENAMNQEAYILFYVRKDSSPWFSTFKETMKLCPRDIPGETSPTSVLHCSENFSPEDFCGMAETCFPSPKESPDISATREGDYNQNIPRPCWVDDPIVSKDSAKANPNLYSDDEVEYCCEVSPAPTQQPNEVRPYAPARRPEGSTPSPKRQRISHVGNLARAPRRDEQATPQQSNEVCLDASARRPEGSMPSPMRQGISPVDNQTKAPRRGALETPRRSNDVFLDASARTLVRAMPGSRRRGILACLSKQQQQQQKHQLNSSRNVLQPLRNS